MMFYNIIVPRSRQFVRHSFFELNTHLKKKELNMTLYTCTFSTVIFISISSIFLDVAVGNPEEGKKRR